jgi:predicted aspartyl protease
MPSRLPRLAATLCLLVPLLITGCASIEKLAVTRASPLRWNGHDRIELPLSRDSVGRPVVPGRILGEDTAVLVDSGGGWPLMTPALAAAAGARADGATTINGRSYATAADVPLQLGGASIELGKVAIGHQTAETEFALGPELFLQAVVEMDFDAGRLTLIRPGTFRSPAVAALPVQIVANKPTVQLHVNGRDEPVCAILDTGFNSGLALSGEVLAALALPRGAAETSVTGPGGAQWSAPARAALEQVSFGNQRYRDVPLTEKKSDVAWSCPNLLGMAVLSRHRLVFDLRNRQVWLLPRSLATVSRR